MARAYVTLAVLVGLQVLDVFVHVATGQVEIIRMTSNAILIAGAAVSVFASPRARIVILVSGILYLVLNLAFLVQHGLVNPATEALRIPLFGFVAVSLALTAGLRHQLTIIQPSA